MSAVFLPGTAVRLESRVGGSRKFWEVSLVRDDPPNCYIVPVRWGRLGTAGQGKPQRFASRYEAEEFIARKVREKLREGYVRVGTAALDRAAEPSECAHAWLDVSSSSTPKGLANQICSRCSVRRVVQVPEVVRQARTVRDAVRERFAPPRVQDDLAFPAERIIRLTED